MRVACMIVQTCSFKQQCQPRHLNFIGSQGRGGALKLVAYVCMVGAFYARTAQLQLPAFFEQPVSDATALWYIN